MKTQFYQMVAAVGGLMVLASAHAASAQSQPYEDAEPARRWRVDVGGGVLHGDNVARRSDQSTQLTPWASADYRQIIYANGLDGLGWNAVVRDDLRAGFQIRPRFGAQEVQGSSLARPELGADAAAYAYKRLPGNIVVGGYVAKDISGDQAGMSYGASIGHQRVTRVGLVQFSGYLDGGDDARVGRYFGVRPEEAPASGLAPFKPKGGLSTAGAVAFLAVPLGERYGMGAFVNYEQQLGDARLSPVVEDRERWRTGLVFVARFSSAD